MFGFRLIAVEHTYTDLGLYWQFVCLMNFGSTSFFSIDDAFSGRQLEKQ